MAEAQEVLRRSNLTQYAVFNYGFNRTVQAGANKADNVTILGASAGLIDAWNLKVEYGRPLSDEEFNSAPGFAMIGSELGSQLFPGLSPIGKSVKVQGFNLKVTGVFEKMGQDMFGTSMDNRVLIPVKLASRMVDPRQDIGQSIIVKGKTDIPVQRLMDELEGLMRSIRRIKPFEENDFALNEVSLIAGRLDSLFAIINFAGWIIGGFSIVVGGFGIANIMFVSVRERTKIIGLQKAMGAKKRFILMEFLFEASVLSLIGGAIGLAIIYVSTFIVNKVYDLTLTLTIGNIIMGLAISIVIGMIAGLVPARTAARLDPVTAMNTI
jgi:putative ABC transport system permease protein